MNEGSESSAVLTPEQALLIEGCKSYLDVIHAINAFQTRVCQAACDVINEARDRIFQVARLDEPSEALANAYVSPASADNNFDGSSASVGASIWLDRPVQAQLHLALVFDHDPNRDQQIANVFFALEVHRQWLLNQLSNVFRGDQDWRIYNDWGWLAVELRRPVENPQNIREELTTMLDNALTRWDNCSNNATANGENT